MHYNYFAFGLNIESEIECSPLLESGGSAPDVIIRLGSVPSELEGASEQGSFFQVSEEKLLLKIDQVARYLVSGGCEIIVEPHPDAEARDVRLFLLGSAMGALLHQRGAWPLHGGAVAFQQGAAIFVGATGSGKSTLVGAFYQRGYQVLTDDVCAITTSTDGSLQVWPAVPRIRLWSDSVAELGGDPTQLTRTRAEVDKYDVLLQKFRRHPSPIRAIYALYTSADQETLQLTPLHGFDKIQELTLNTYRLPFLTSMQLAPQHFQQAQALARQARVVRITRPTQPFLLDELADLIERDLAK